MVFAQQPTTTVAGVPIAAPAVTVDLEDQFGNVETLDTSSQLSMAVATPVGPPSLV